MQGEYRNCDNCAKSETRFASGFLFPSRLIQINQVLILEMTANDKEASGSLSAGFTQCNPAFLTEDEMTLMQELVGDEMTLNRNLLEMK